jgi:two-component system, OmpR family, sensor kinase
MNRFDAAPATPEPLTWRRRRTPDEIDRLAYTFERMSTRIADYVGRLRRVDELRRELIANVSHDLRTPLAAVRGYLDTLLLRDRPVSESERQQHLEHAAVQARRLDRLVTELLDLAKLEGGEMSLQPESFAACELVQDVAQKFELVASRHQVVFEQRLDPDAPMAWGDIRLIERVVDNLLDNAFRHTPAGGKVAVICEPRNSSIAIEVRDSGAGIHPDDLPHIFERFYRGRNVDRQSGGAGLGLAICKRIVDLHESTLSVANLPEGGVVFSFTLQTSTAATPELASATQHA